MTDKALLLASISSTWQWETDADLRFTSMSERFTEVFGWPVSAILAKRSPDLDRTDYDSPGWQLHLDDLAQHRPFRNFDTTFIDVSGARPVRVSGAPMFSPDGVFKGYIGEGLALSRQRSLKENSVSFAPWRYSIVNCSAGFVRTRKRLKPSSCESVVASTWCPPIQLFTSSSSALPGLHSAEAARRLPSSDLAKALR